MPNIVGAWVVEHGLLTIGYSFADNGNYKYERYGSGRDEEETGTYALEGDRLTLKPEGKPQKLFRWSVGSDVTAMPGEYVLWLFDSYGGKEMFYPK